MRSRPLSTFGRSSRSQEKTDANVCSHSAHTMTKILSLNYSGPARKGPRAPVGVRRPALTGQRPAPKTRRGDAEYH